MSKTTLVQVRFPDGLLKDIDDRSVLRGDRSEFIRSACREKMDRVKAEERENEAMGVPAV